jgi:hypothetical protein
MRGKFRHLAPAVFAIVGLSLLAGCIVAPAPGYYDHHHRHGYHDGYRDRDHWR